jgi:BolA family transcriptional regulator, general stress-responsive regulator
METFFDADKQVIEPINKTSPRADRMRMALSSCFPGAQVLVRDDSLAHAGHAGAQPGGETHYHVQVQWGGFAQMAPIARHRAINEALHSEFSGGLHALSIEARP